MFMAQSAGGRGRAGSFIDGKFVSRTPGDEKKLRIHSALKPNLTSGRPHGLKKIPADTTKNRRLTPR